LPNVGPYIYDVSISGFTRSSIYIYIYIYDISSLWVNSRNGMFPVHPKHIHVCREMSLVGMFGRNCGIDLNPPWNFAIE